MRLFTGLAIPEPIVHSLSRLLDLLRPTAQLHWCPIYNLHITTKFIGSWPEEHLEELIEALHKVPVPPPIKIQISGLGWFPNPHSPRILWAGVHTPESLAELAGATDQAVAALGIEKEAKKFSPHLTLARIKEPTPLVEIKRTIASLHSVDFGEFTADRFHLYRSEPGPSSSIYTQLAEFPFKLT